MEIWIEVTDGQGVGAWQARPWIPARVLDNLVHAGDGSGVPIGMGAHQVCAGDRLHVSAWMLGCWMDARYLSWSDMIVSVSMSRVYTRNRHLVTLRMLLHRRMCTRNRKRVSPGMQGYEMYARDVGGIPQWMSP
jgi:hypothetical protein